MTTGHETPGKAAENDHRGSRLDQFKVTGNRAKTKTAERASDDACRADQSQYNQHKPAEPGSLATQGIDARAHE